MDTTDSKPQRIVAYLRVSTNEQAEEGVSLEAQEHAIRCHCEPRGIEVIAVVSDPGVSAGKPLRKRPGGEKLLDIIAESGATGVMATKLDRLFRNTIDCLTMAETWKAQGVALHLLDLGGQTLDTTSPMGATFLTMAAAFAQLERQLIGERTRAALAAKRRKGERVGRVPYGYDEGPGGVLRLNLGEQAVLGAIRQWRGGGSTLQAIADLLNEGQTSPPRAQKGGKQGVAWYPTTISLLLKRPDPAAQDSPS